MSGIPSCVIVPMYRENPVFPMRSRWVSAKRLRGWRDHVIPPQAETQSLPTGIGIVWDRRPRRSTVLLLGPGQMIAGVTMEWIPANPDKSGPGMTLSGPPSPFPRKRYNANGSIPLPPLQILLPASIILAMQDSDGEFGIETDPER